MRKQVPILIYILTFLVLSMSLKLAGIIDFDNTEIFGYTFVFYGISTVYISLGKNKGISVFLGSAVFSAGIVMLVISGFDILQPSSVYFPSFLFILGIGSFMLFVDRTEDKIFLLIAIIFALLGMIFTFTQGSPDISSFLDSLEKIVLNYWEVILLSLLILLLLKRDQKED